MAKKMTGRTASTGSKGDMTEEIRRKAREIYEKSGCRAGRDTENWLEAERIVKSKTCCC